MNKEARRSKIDIVRAELTKEPPTPRYEMPKTTGLKRRDVSGVFNYLRRLGEIPRPTEEESSRTMAESVSDAKGGTLLFIQPYLGGDMDAVQIRDMVYLEQGIVVDLDKVRISQHHYKHKLAHPSNGRPLNRKPVEAIEARRRPDRFTQVVRSLALRQANVDEISRIARFIKHTKTQTEAELERLGIKPIKQEPKPRKTEEEIHEEMLMFRTASALVKAGVITEDISGWNEIWNEIERQFEATRKQPPSLARGIILEAMLKTKKQGSESDQRISDILSGVGSDIFGKLENELDVVNSYKYLEVRGFDNADIRRLLFEELNSENKDETNTISFARELINQGYIAESLSAWNFNQSLDRQLGKEWTPAEKIVREVYTKARIHEIKGKKDLMRAYIDLGSSIDPIWFNNAELNGQRKVARGWIEASAKIL